MCPGTRRTPISLNALFAALLVLLAVVDLACAQESAPPAEIDPAVVIAYQGDAVLTQGELDAAFSKLPEQDRLRFIRDGARVDQLIASLLRRKLVALDAEQHGFDDEPLVADRVRLAAEKELAEAWLQRVQADAPAADYEVLAQEDYLVNPDRYRNPVVLDLSHILIGTSSRSDSEALELARQLEHALEQDPSRFDAYVIEYSDDPSKADNDGRFPEMVRGQMVAPFENAAFKLEQPGQISPPVKTQYGYHLIRLNERKGGELPPFEAVRDQAIANVTLAYQDSFRLRYLEKLTSAPIVIPEGAVDIMVRRHFGDDLELAPSFDP